MRIGIRQRVVGGVSLAIVLAWASVSAAQLYVYPDRGQSPEQQSRDKGDCHVWAVQQSGFDPTRTASTPPPSSGASAGRGAVRGAAVGAVGGAIGGDAGKGAAIGAASGALIGGMRRADERARYQQQQAVVAQGNDSYTRAYGACLSGRGYTVR